MVQPAGLRVPARMANGPDQEAPASISRGGQRRTALFGVRRPSSSPSRPAVAVDGGGVEVSGLVLRELADQTAASLPPPTVSASSSSPGADPALAMDGSVTTAWKSAPATGAAQVLTIDFHQPREFGGLIVRWLAGAHATRYDVEFSDDGAGWRTMRRIAGARGGFDGIWLPEAETRFLRLVLHEGIAQTYGLAEIEVKPLAFGVSANAFFQGLARESPRGTYPRGMSGEQPTWTLVGIDGGEQSGLLSEDGALEVSRGGFSIEPFVVAGSRVVGWADVEARQFLIDGDLPMPGVTWRAPQWELRVLAFASGDRGRSRLVARYELRSLTDRPLPLELVLAVRPFQVNPPSQFLSTVGRHERDCRHRLGRRSPRRQHAPQGFSPEPAGRGRHASVRRRAGPRADRHAGLAGAEPRSATSSAMRRPRSATDSRCRHAAGRPWARRAAFGTGAPPDLKGETATTWMSREQCSRRCGVARATRAACRSTSRAPAGHWSPLLAHGTRARADHARRPDAPARDAILCAVLDPRRRDDRRIAAAPRARADVARRLSALVRPASVRQRQGALLRRRARRRSGAGERQRRRVHLPRRRGLPLHAATARCSRRCGRTSRRPRATSSAAPSRAHRCQAARRGQRAFYGLLPASISHEGYSAKPMHSYWDDFWALKGYDGAVADRRGARPRRRRAPAGAAARRVPRRPRRVAAPPSPRTASTTFRARPSSATSIRRPRRSPSRPAASFMRLPPDAGATATFERYWREFVDRRDGRRDWDDYTPYELRNVGTFVRLGWRDRAHELLAFFMAGRRPPAWNQWPEVVGRDPRAAALRRRPAARLGRLRLHPRRAGSVRVRARRATTRSCSPPAFPPAGSTETGIAVKGLRTRTDRLSYSLRARRAIAC